MMKRSMLPLALTALVGLTLSFASTAMANPSETGPCSDCHSGANVPITAAVSSSAGGNTTYDVVTMGASAIAVFDGGTKLFTFEAPSGQFTVADGKTYTLYAIAGPSESDGLGTMDVSPAATPGDTTAPITASDAKTTYVSEATIALTATDNSGGSGVAHTYYVLDGAAQVEGTSASITTTGTHTLEFWSVDVAGNIEPRNSATFDVTDATTPPVVKTRTVHVHVNLRHTHAKDLTATLTDKATGATFTSTVDRRGNMTFKNVPNGMYRLTISGSRFDFAARTVYVGPHHAHHAHSGHTAHHKHHSSK